MATTTVDNSVIQRVIRMLNKVQPDNDDDRTEITTLITWLEVEPSTVIPSLPSTLNGE